MTKAEISHCGPFERPRERTNAILDGEFDVPILVSLATELRTPNYYSCVYGFTRLRQSRRENFSKDRGFRAS